MSDDADQTLDPAVEPAVSDHEAALLEAYPQLMPENITRHEDPRA